MHGTRITSRLTRRHFVLAGSSAAGGLMIGIGAGPRSAHAADRDGPALE